MGIASFSPPFGCATGLSVLLTPIKALAVRIASAPIALLHTRPAGSPAKACRDSVSSLAACKANQVQQTGTAANAKSIRPVVLAAPVQRLKVVQYRDPGVSRSCAGRLFISGRMSDVCAELDRMAR